MGEREKHLIPLLIIALTAHGRKVWVRMKDEEKSWEIMVDGWEIKEEH